jgi:hypothetical protein
MMQIGPWREVNYVNDILPELIWIGLINNTLGYVNGARLFEKIVESALGANSELPKKNYAILSELGSLAERDREVFLSSLEEKSILTQFRNIVAPLVLLYEECPIKYIGPPTGLMTNEQLVHLVTTAVDRHFDKYETPGVVLNGAVLVGRIIAGTIHHATGEPPPDLNSVIEKPDSDEAARAAGYMRNTAMQEFGMRKNEPKWSRYFWNNNYRLSKCTFERAGDE